MLNIERLLLIAEKYVLFVEEVHTAPRTILPHGSSFHGTPLSLYISSETPKMEFSLTVSFLFYLVGQNIFCITLLLLNYVDPL